MFEYNKRPPGRKPDHGNADIDDVTDAERAVVIIATRFALPLNVARLIAHHAGLGGQR
jgi:hypothetical protein